MWIWFILINAVVLKIEGQDKEKSVEELGPCASTRAQTGGNPQHALLQLPPIRCRRQKNKVEESGLVLSDSSEPPTHPAIKKKDEPAWLTEVRRKFERDTNFVQNIPSISQLRDYPNTSVPLPIGSKLAGKKFAKSTPNSPKAKEEFNFGQDIGACSTPVGSWDNSLEPPTYQSND